MLFRVVSATWWSSVYMRWSSTYTNPRMVKPLYAQKVREGPQYLPIFWSHVPNIPYASTIPQDDIGDDSGPSVGTSPCSEVFCFLAMVYSSSQQELHC